MREHTDLSLGSATDELLEHVTGPQACVPCRRRLTDVLAWLDRAHRTDVDTVPPARVPWGVFRRQLFERTWFPKPPTWPAPPRDYVYLWPKASTPPAQSVRDRVEAIEALLGRLGPREWLYINPSANPATPEDGGS